MDGLPWSDLHHWSRHRSPQGAQGEQARPGQARRRCQRRLYRLGGEDAPQGLILKHLLVLWATFGNGNISRRQVTVQARSIDRSSCIRDIPFYQLSLTSQRQYHFAGILLYSNLYSCSIDRTHQIISVRESAEHAHVLNLFVCCKPRAFRLASWHPTRPYATTRHLASL